MVATDGHRLALAETDHKFSGLNAEARVLVPKKALTGNPAACAEAGEDEMVEFARDDSYLFFQVGSRRLVSRILTGQFPNYEAVLPRENNKSVALERGRIERRDPPRVAACGPALARGENRHFARGRGDFRAEPRIRRSDGNARQEYKGDPITIGFNAQYMLDFLAAAAEGPIRLELKDEQSAGELRPMGDEAYRYRYVIMPMRI